MALYYTPMVQAIDLLKEDARLLPVQFASAPPPAPPAAVTETKSDVPPVFESLKRAEELLKTQDFEKAEELFQEASNSNVSKHVQAAGFYGLARIALAKGEPEDAETLFEHTLESQPDGQVRSWALVYLGKLRLEVMDKEHAAKYFQEAIHVEGASDAAVKEAWQGLDKSLKK
jgi:tetratricopeptide (TPR) repeat protein